MAVLLDTNVLIDIAVRDPVWHRWSRRQLEQVQRQDAVIINQIIFSEFSTRYESIDEVEALLPEDEIRREGLPWAAAFAASRAFGRYRRQGGSRDRIPPDFYIGAHAAVRDYSILTRDPQEYRAYFPDVRLITPDTHP